MTPNHVFKYSIGLLKAHSNDTTYHRLVKNLKFSSTKNASGQDNQEDFDGVVVWARRVSEKGLDKCFWDMLS